MYEIGEDIPAGEYFVECANSWGAYFAICSDAEGTLDSIIANDNFDTFCYVTVKKGEFFELRHGRFIEVEYAPEDVIDEHDRAKGRAGEGMYKIGRDLPAGKYKLHATDSDFDAYVSVMKDSRHTLKSIVSNDLFENTKYVTVKKGQYLYISRAYIDLP